ncbi:MAG: type phosphodiesterase/nucleotide pyrophosphatase [Candidatus Solibacter sp.]|nr:type phosphodiesterase/nucleotide pyrophosphatase [Candidatus Solibacter sp.]
MKFALGILCAGILLTGCSHQITTQAAGKRMIVLGIDGMDPAFLEAHWSSLPNLNKLRQKGDFRRLGTTVPPQSPVAWSTVITGMDPGGHGIFDFVHRNPATRMPMSSMAEVTEATHNLSIGPYVIPLSGGGVRALREGRAFWQILGESGVAAKVIRMPANFPPADCEQESLSGMGTPDMTGAFGTFTFFTDDPAEKRTNVPGGRVQQVKVENGRTSLHIEGPANSLRKDHAITAADVTVHVDPKESAARFDLDGQQFILREGEWSEWVHASFKLLPVKSTSGILRVYLQKAHPYLRIYVSPVNIDPQDPALPISTPAKFSTQLADSLGPFYTQGIAEETSAWRAGLFTREEFLTQSRKVLADSLRMFRYELDRYQGGLLFYYFSSVDQNAHMLWGRYEADLLGIYQGVDAAIGDAMAKAGNDTDLVILSDHGFARFDRTVHLNTFLMKQGLLTLDDPANVGDAELFQHVDWSRTMAYAIGLNGIYLNLEGRENGGVVPVADRQVILDRISRALKEWKDPVNGSNVVDQVYFPETAFKGKNLKYSPDLFVGFKRGYRASWQTALGAVPPVLLDDNTQAWIGDHCMASDEVPGVLLSNRKFKATAPQLFDVTATILAEFGVRKPGNMIGQSVF